MFGLKLRFLPLLLLLKFFTGISFADVLMTNTETFATPIVLSQIEIVPLSTCHLCDNTVRLHIRATVQNLAFRKVVSARLTTDGWHSYQDVTLQHITQLSPHYEEWGAAWDVSVRNPEALQNAELALRVDMGGRTYWDSNNNYPINRAPSLRQPVRMGAYSVSYASDSGFSVQGTINTLVAPNTSVRVHYGTSIDNPWGSILAVAPTRAGRWRFSIPLSDEESQSHIAIWIEMTQSGTTVMDTNDGSGYRTQVRPTLHISRGLTALSSSQTATRIPAAGSLPLRCEVRSEIAAESVRIGWGGGHWSPGNTLTVATANLGDGEHVFICHARFGGGYETQTSLTVVVANRIALEGSQTLPRLNSANSTHRYAIATTEFSSAAIRLGARLSSDNQGHLFTTTMNGRLVKLSPSTTPMEATPFESLPQGARRLDDIAATPSGRVYGLSTRSQELLLWRADGSLDTSFGTDGHQSLSLWFDNLSVCQNARIAATETHVAVVDPCNSRILLANITGESGSAASIPTSPQHPWIEGAAISFPDSEHLVVAVPRGILFWKIDQREQLHLDRALATTLPLIPEGVAVQGEQVWLSSGRFLGLLNSTGEVLALWTSTSGESDFGFSSGFTAVAGNQVALVSTDTEQLVVFSAP